MKLIKLDRFRRMYFEAGSAPDSRTIKSWIEKGAIPGVVINGRVFVDQERWEGTWRGNIDSDVSSLMERVL